jgi:hypothetical protein
VAVGTKASVSLQGANIHNNSATNAGGGVYMNGTSVTITHSIDASNNVKAITKISTNSVSNSTVSANGGGFYINAGTAYFEDCEMIGNSATAAGGAVYQFGGNVNMYGADINNNTANLNGGGVYLYDGNFYLGGTVKVNNNYKGATVQSDGTLDTSKGTKNNFEIKVGEYIDFMTDTKTTGYM